MKRQSREKKTSTLEINTQRFPLYLINGQSGCDMKIVIVSMFSFSLYVVLFMTKPSLYVEISTTKRNTIAHVEGDTQIYGRRMVR